MMPTLELHLIFHFLSSSDPVHGRSERIMNTFSNCLIRDFLECVYT